MAEVAMETCWVLKKKMRVGLQGSGQGDMYANTDSYHEEVAGFPSHQDLLRYLIGGVGRLKQSVLSEKEGGNPSIFRFRHSHPLKQH